MDTGALIFCSGLGTALLLMFGVARYWQQRAIGAEVELAQVKKLVGMEDE